SFLMLRPPPTPTLFPYTTLFRSRLHQGMTDEQLESTFLGAPEYIQTHGGKGAGWVSGMYNDLLGRDADPDGLNYWVAQLNRGVSPYDIAYGFAASKERETTRVQLDYQQYLNRQADPQGVDAWVNNFL